MSRLIDADILNKCVEESRKNNCHKNRNVYINHKSEHDHFIHMICCQPTAFDVEKVVEELENLREVELHTVDMCDELGNGDGESQYNDGRSQGRYEAFIEAIEIVKRGGRND